MSFIATLYKDFHPINVTVVLICLWVITYRMTTSKVIFPIGWVGLELFFYRLEYFFWFLFAVIFMLLLVLFIAYRKELSEIEESAEIDLRYGIVPELNGMITPDYLPDGTLNPNSGGHLFSGYAGSKGYGYHHRTWVPQGYKLAHIDDDPKQIEKARTK